MKKLLSVILSLALLCTCCMTAAAVESAAGTWYLHQAQAGDQIINAADIGLSMNITLLPDGTASAYSAADGEENHASGTWTQAGTDVLIVLDGDAPATCTLEDGVLYLSEQSTGVLFMLTREMPMVAGSYVPAAPRADAQLADYLGHWDCTLAENDGQQIIPADYNITVQLTISDDELFYYVNNQGEEVSAIMIPVMDGGALNATHNGETIITLQLLEDGTVLMLLEDLYYYFTPVVPAA